jgi:predicted alpha/beta hydrolase family esterase
MKKHQVIIIHGGDTFDTYMEYLEYLKGRQVTLEYLLKKGWKSTIDQKLGPEFQVIAPQMPNKHNAKYLEWKIWFEKLIPFIEEEAIFIGHSMGGIFMAKYLSENNFPKKIKATFLIAAPYDASQSLYSLGDFALTEPLERFQGQGGQIFLYQSTDDPVVDFSDFEKYQKALPKACSMVFEGKGHFNQEQFPELVGDLRALIAHP